MADLKVVENVRCVWAEDGHVFIEGADGTRYVMSPEAALDLSRQLGAAGADSLINKVMDSDIS